MRSKVADEVREAQLEKMRAMTPDERVTLAMQLGEQSLADYMATTGLDREEALRRIRHAKQATRARYSASKAG